MGSYLMTTSWGMNLKTAILQMHKVFLSLSQQKKVKGHGIYSHVVKSIQRLRQ